MADSGLIVRRSVRFEISLPARMRIAAHHADAISFAKGVCGENRWIEISVIDFAQGGLGFMTDVFLPRQVDLEIEIPSGSGEEIYLNCELRVQRVQMTDRRPGYKIGGAFINLVPETESQIESMLDRMSNECDQQEGEHA